MGGACRLLFLCGVINNLSAFLSLAYLSCMRVLLQKHHVYACHFICQVKLLFFPPHDLEVVNCCCSNNTCVSLSLGYCLIENYNYVGPVIASLEEKCLFNVAIFTCKLMIMIHEFGEVMYINIGNKLFIYFVEVTCFACAKGNWQQLLMWC